MMLIMILELTSMLLHVLIFVNTLISNLSNTFISVLCTCRDGYVHK